MKFDDLKNQDDKTERNIPMISRRTMDFDNLKDRLVERSKDAETVKMGFFALIGMVIGILLGLIFG